MDSKLFERYSRQILFTEIGEAGQRRLLESSAVLVGCGALGTALANLLVRAGVGKLRIVDRDFVEPSNLQRQTLFEESDALEALPKAVAAERRLPAINSGAGAGVIAWIESAEAIKLLLGKPDSVGGRLVSFDVWSGRYQSVRVARTPACRACVQHDFRYLEGDAQPHLTMCGRDSVQIHERRRQLDLPALGRRLAPTVAEVRENGFLLRFRVPPYEMTVFADGRAIIKGTRDTSVARSLYARYIGT